MKNNILFALLILTGRAFAQDASPAPSAEPKKYTREIGVFGHVNMGSSNTNEDVNLAGVHFKKWRNGYQGFRVIAGYGSYSNYQNFYSNGHQQQVQDTLVEKFTENNINMGVIGFGVEAKRTFYKRVVLFAAIELRGGYGSGKQRDYTAISVNNLTENYYERHLTASRDADLIYIAATPSIGAKIQFKRLNFGMESTAVNLNMTNLSINGKGNGTGNFDLGGNISNRLFLSYGF